MEANEQQTSEIDVLKSIYYDAFFESPPPKAWKGAARLPEFNIRVKHDSQPNFFFIVNVKFPKSYPSKSIPILSITQYNGLTPTQVTTLTNLMHQEAQKHIGGEAVFAVTSFAEEWFNTSVKPPNTASGLSLAIEMQNRALEKEKAMKEEAEFLAKVEDDEKKRLEKELLHQIEQNARHREELQRQEQEERQKARRRAYSDVTERPSVESTIESFDEDVEVSGIKFDSVRLYHGRKESLGLTYSAEPVCDDSSEAAALELHVVVIEANYYRTQQGRKKIDQLVNEIKRLTKLQSYEHVQRVFAVQVSKPTSIDSIRIVILMEKRPSMTVKDLLQDCDGLREDRVKSYTIQICDGLCSIHDATLVHRAISASNIGLADQPSGSKTVKLIRAAFYTKLHDLHRSESFGPKCEPDISEPSLPDDWLYSGTLESPLSYSRHRDMHSLGVLVLQMLSGLDIASRYQNPQAALLDSGVSERFSRIIEDLIKPGKKSAGPPGATEVLSRLEPRLITVKSKPQSIPINGTPISVQDIRTPVARITYPTGSPEASYFGGLDVRYRRSSRWREDYEQLEVLGKGGFGQVVKARNLIDNNIYAVKKIKLRTAQGDNKIFREVNALSRLSHRYIVRYYTTWLEEAEPTSSNVSSDSGDERSGDSEDQTAGLSMIKTPDEDYDDPTSIDLNDLVLKEDTQTSSFPSIRFTSGDVADDSSDEEESSKHLVEQIKKNRLGLPTPPSLVRRTLYIQMEYVERQTLKERIAEGITEEEAWRLFQQIVDALVHMASLGILHRDIKLTNIFIDSNGDCKVGDFGLATSSLAVVDPSDVAPMAVATFSDMTLDVGTRLYIAPEILSKRGGSRERDLSKADLYSLGIVFFEMNYKFSTETERIFVIESLRHPDVVFPSDWDPKRDRQREIIRWLLQHEPSKRPPAIQLSQSPLLPPRLEDEYFKEASQTMTNRENRHYPAVLSSLFSQSRRSARDPLYDQGFPETAILRHDVVVHLDNLFRLHGARDVDVPLLMPLTDKHMDVSRQVLLLDQHGEVLTLPANGLLPLARLASRKALSRIKRYHVGDTYRAGAALSHPTVSSTAIFDIITPDTVNGVEVGSAELLTLVDECLGTFPNLAKTYQVHVSHSKISEIMMSRIPDKLQECVLDVLQATKVTTAQRRATLQKKGLQKALIDELECLYEDYEDMNVPLLRLEKINSPLAETVRPLLKEVASTIALATAAGIQNSVICIQPLMVGRRHDYFKNGICFEVVNPARRTDILAIGGRYDQLISQFYSPMVKKPPFVAVCIQIALERITSAIATFQSNFMSNSLRSYDYWNARRCDVYIASFQPGYLNIRLEVAALLWRNGIRADLMYETGVSDPNMTMEALVELCYNEGILFIIIPPKVVKMGQTEVYEFRVKSVLRKNEIEVSRQDLVSWLQQQIAEQKKTDLSSSGVSNTPSDMHALVSSPSVASSTSRDTYSATSDLQVLLPGDALGMSLKKQRRQTKQLFYDRAFDKRVRLKNALQTSGTLPMIAVDIPPVVFDAIARSDAWVTDDDAWRAILSLVPSHQIAYALQVRDAVAKRRDEGGSEFVMLYAVKEERIALLNLTAKE